MTLEGTRKVEPSLAYLSVNTRYHAPQNRSTSDNLINEPLFGYASRFRSLTSIKSPRHLPTRVKHKLSHAAQCRQSVPGVTHPRISVRRTGSVTNLFPDMPRTFAHSPLDTSPVLYLRETITCSPTPHSAGSQYLFIRHLESRTVGSATS